MDTLVLGVAAAYLVVHCGVYIGILRDRPAFGREPVIFAYHALSFAVVGVGSLAAVVALPTSEPLAVLVAVVALHGIYSISFLELWALAEGGYSLSILRAVNQAGTGSGAVVDLTRLQVLGAAKRQNRILGLLRLGLARIDGEMMHATPRGRMVAAVLRLITWPAGLRKSH